MNYGEEKLVGIIYIGHGCAPGCWDEGNVCIEGNIVGRSIAELFTLCGGDDEMHRRIISMTSSFTEVGILHLWNKWLSCIWYWWEMRFQMQWGLMFLINFQLLV